MEISREQFKELMGLEDSDMGMEMADECYEEIGNWKLVESSQRHDS